MKKSGHILNDKYIHTAIKDTIIPVTHPILSGTVRFVYVIKFMAGKPTGLPVKGTAFNLPFFVL